MFENFKIYKIFPRERPRTPRLAQGIKPPDPPVQAPPPQCEILAKPLILSKTINKEWYIQLLVLMVIGTIY